MLWSGAAEKGSNQAIFPRLLKPQYLVVEKGQKEKRNFKQKVSLHGFLRRGKSGNFLRKAAGGSFGA